MRILKVVCVLLAVAAVPAATADIAAAITGGTGGTPGDGTNHGWTFEVNRADIILTHLGLYDREKDGLAGDHPIGIWDAATKALLVSGTMHAGAGDPLIDNFRYIDVKDVTLKAGMKYTLGFYSTGTGTQDFMVTSATGKTINPAITWLNGNWDWPNKFQMPANSTGADRFGPNFQFIPEPATLMLLGLGALLRRR